MPRRAATSPSPAAGYPMGRRIGPCASPTDLFSARTTDDFPPERSSKAERANDATASLVPALRLRVRAAVFLPRACGRPAAAQGGTLGAQDRKVRLSASRSDDAALHRRVHRP